MKAVRMETFKGFIARLRRAFEANQAILVIVLIFGFAKLSLLFRHHIPGWDESVYLSMGKYIYSAGSSGLWETIRPPGLSLILGALWKLNLPYLLFSEIIAALFGAGNLILTYLIARKAFNRNVAILSAALLAASPLFYHYSSSILTEVPSAFFVLVAAYLYLNRKYWLCGVACSLATLFKFTNVLVLLAVLLALCIEAAQDVLKRRNLFIAFQSALQKAAVFAKIALAFGVTTVPFLVFNYLFYGASSNAPIKAMLRPFVDASWHQSNPAKAVPGLYNYAFYVVQVAKQHLLFVFLLAALVAFWKGRWFRDRGKVFLMSYLAVFFAYFTYIVNKDERFLLLFLPAISIFSAAAFFNAFDALKHKWAFARRAIVAMLVASFVIALAVDYAVSFRDASDEHSLQELYESVSRFGIKGPVLTSDPIFAFFSNNRFFHYYDTAKPQELKPSYEWETEPFEAIIYSPQNLFCFNGDAACVEKHAQLYAELSSKYVHIFNGTYYSGWADYYLFVNASMYEGQKN